MRMREAFVIAICTMFSFVALGCAGGELHGGTIQEPTQQEAPASAEAEHIEQGDSTEANGDPVEESPKDLIVSESGFSVDSYGQIYYAAIIENPNTSWAAENISVNITIKDADGNIIGSESDYLSTLFASGKLAVCGYTFDAEDAASIEVSPTVSGNCWTMIPDVTQGDIDRTLYVDSLNIVPGDFDTTITGAAHSDTDSEFSLARANIVLRNNNGDIVGGTFTYIDTMAPQSTNSFSASVDSEIPVDKAEAYLDLGYVMD